MSVGQLGKHLQYLCNDRRMPSLVQAKFNHVESAHPDLPLPNPIYLSIHATCCRVAHLSGAGEYIEKILEDLEDI